MQQRGCDLLLVTILGLTVLRTPPARAQDEGPVPDGSDAPKPYVPPSAAKSVEIGDYYLKTKKYNAALSRFQEAVKSDPDYAPAYLGLGKVYEKIGLRQKALAAYQKYLDALPSAKDAEDAKQVHQAIARLERGLGHGKSRQAATSSSGAARDPH